MSDTAATKVLKVRLDEINRAMVAAQGDIDRYEGRITELRGCLESQAKEGKEIEHALAMLGVYD